MILKRKNHVQNITKKKKFMTKSQNLIKRKGFDKFLKGFISFFLSSVGVQRLKVIVLKKERCFTNLVIFQLFTHFLIFIILQSFTINGPIDQYSNPSFLFIIIKNQYSMFSFINQNASSTSSNPLTNPELHHLTEQRTIPNKLQEVNGKPNEAQTPHFPCFQDRSEGQGLFNAYHNHFSNKIGQLNKLISKFEDLGLDVEQAEESEVSHEFASMADSLHEPVPIRKSCSLSEKVYVYDNDQNTVSSPYQIKIISPLKCRLENIKSHCKTVQKELSSVRITLCNFSKDCSNIFFEANASLTNYMANFIESFKQFAKRSESNRASYVFCENFRKENDELQRIFACKEEKIKKLIQQKEEISLQNSKMQVELARILAQNTSKVEIHNEFESILKAHSQLAAKNRELHKQNSQLHQKIEDLEWNLKQARKQLQNSLYESKLSKVETQKKYQEMLYEAIEKLTKKIQKETYQKMKNQSTLKAENEGFFERSLNFNELQTSLNRSYSTKSGEYTYFNSSKLIEPPTLRMKYSSPQNQRTKFTRFDNQFCGSEGYSDKKIEQNERQANRIINDIRMMKASMMESSMANSKYIDRTSLKKSPSNKMI